MEKKFLKKMCRRYENFIYFCVSFMMCILFIFIYSLKSNCSMTLIFNTFAVQAMPFFSAVALGVLLSELACTEKEVFWRFNRCYWYVVIVMLYGAAAVFVTEWNVGMFILAFVFLLRLIPYRYGGFIRGSSADEDE